MHYHPFDTLMELDADQIRLDCAALHLARDVYPYLDVTKHLTILDRVSEEVGALRPGLASTLRYEALREVLVDRWGFRGNVEDYYDPDNSMLNRVIERRRGIPITLSIVWIEVARRLKWPVRGVSFPGRFLVRFDDEDRYVLADPFEEGRSLSIADCEALLAEHFDDVPFSRAMLAAAETRTVLSRLLVNLRSIYLTGRRWGRLEQVLRRLMAVEPDNVRHWQELAMLAYCQGNYHAAYARLASLLEARPEARDDATLQRLAHLRSAMVAAN